MNNAAIAGLLAGILMGMEASVAEAGDQSPSVRNVEHQAELRRELNVLKAAAAEMQNRIAILESQLDKHSAPDAVAVDSSRTPNAVTRSLDRDAANPSLAIDGFCPVELVLREHWIHGSQRYSASYQGRTYWMSSSEAQREFLAEPERFAPVLSGYDAVVLRDQGKLVRGQREYGVYSDGRVYLFASEDSLRRFENASKEYVEFIQTYPWPPEADEKLSCAENLSSQPKSTHSRRWLRRGRCR